MRLTYPPRALRSGLTTIAYMDWTACNCRNVHSLIKGCNNFSNQRLSVGLPNTCCLSAFLSRCPSDPTTPSPKWLDISLSAWVSGSTTTRDAVSRSMTSIPRFEKRSETAVLPLPIPPVTATTNFDIKGKRKPLENRWSRE